MNYSIEIDHQLQCVRVHAEGEADAMEVEIMYRQIAIAANANDLARVYVDYLDLQFDTTAEDIYHTIETLRKHLEGLRVARLHDPASFSYYLTNKLYQQHGLSIKNFDSKDKAFSWLFSDLVREFA